MNYRQFLIRSGIVLLSIAFQGCGIINIKPGSGYIAPIWGNLLAPFGGNTPKLRWMTLDNKLGTIYAWDPGSNVAFINNEGKSCILAASITKSSDTSINIKNSTDVSLDVKLKEEIIKLQEKEKTATAIDIALFHYCMAMLNHIPPQNMDSFMDKLTPIIAPSNSTNKTNQ